VLACAALIVLAFGATPGRAATYVVNSSEDRPDADSLDGQCSAPVTGACTLRAAIMEANAAAGADTIILPAGVYLLTRVAIDDTASGGDLDIHEAVTIQGPGADETIVDGNGQLTSDRVVDVLQGATAVLSGITIRGGKLPGTGIADRGGGIRATSAHLRLERVRLEANSARTGGGLYLAAAEIMIQDSILIGNSAGVYGGGVYAEASTLHLANVILRGNSAERGALSRPISNAGFRSSRR
jgi:CSLREA domain-containing protein